MREEQRQDRKFDARGEPAIYCGHSTMDNRSSYVLYMPNGARPTFVTSYNVVFGNKCPMAKDSPDVSDNEKVALDFRPERLRYYHIEHLFNLGSNRHSLYFANE